MTKGNATLQEPKKEGHIEQLLTDYVSTQILI